MSSEYTKQNLALPFQYFLEGLDVSYVEFKSEKFINVDKCYRQWDFNNTSKLCICFCSREPEQKK